MVSLLQEEARLVPLIVQCVAEGILPWEPKMVYKKLDGKIHALWDQYDSHALETETFLRDIGNVYSMNF